MESLGAAQRDKQEKIPDRGPAERERKLAVLLSWVSGVSQKEMASAAVSAWLGKRDKIRIQTRPAPPLTQCVVLGKLWNFSESQFPYL